MPSIRVCFNQKSVREVVESFYPNFIAAFKITPNMESRKIILPRCFVLVAIL